MTNKSLSEQVSTLVNLNAGQTEDPTDDDKKFAAEYAQAVDDLIEEARQMAFMNVIRSEGRCGFANGGTINYLLNTDGGSRYRVTVRTYWRQGIESGQYDRIYVSEPGGRQILGCTDSGSIPVAYYNRQVVGEVRI